MSESERKVIAFDWLSSRMNRVEIYYFGESPYVKVGPKSYAADTLLEAIEIAIKDN